MTSVGVMASAVNVSAGPGTDVLMEPFNNFTTNGWVLGGSPTIVAGRTGTAARVSGSSGAASYNIPSGNQSADLTIGFAWQQTNLGSDILFLRSDAGATDHNRINVGALGQIIFSRGSVSIANSVNGLVAINTWNYLEVRCTLADAGGIATVQLNGANVITATDLDTKNAGTKTVYDQVRFATPDGRVYLIDDLYLSVGGAPFKGNITIP
jgi:hypothetical protein